MNFICLFIKVIRVISWGIFSEYIRDNKNNIFSWSAFIDGILFLVTIFASFNTSFLKNRYAYHRIPDAEKLCQE